MCSNIWQHTSKNILSRCGTIKNNWLVPCRAWATALSCSSQFILLSALESNVFAWFSEVDGRIKCSFRWPTKLNISWEMFWIFLISPFFQDTRPKFTNGLRMMKINWSSKFRLFRRCLTTCYNRVVPYCTLTLHIKIISNLVEVEIS